MSYNSVLKEISKLESEHQRLLEGVGADNVSNALTKLESERQSAVTKTEELTNRLREVCEAAGETNLNQLNAVRAIQALKKEKSTEAASAPEEFQRIPKHYRHGSKRVPATRLKWAMNQAHAAITAVLSQVPQTHYDELKRELVRLWGNPNVPLAAFINGAYDALDHILTTVAVFAEKDYSADFLRTQPFIDLLGEAVAEELADLCDWSPFATATFPSDWEVQPDGSIPALWFVFKTLIRATGDEHIHRYADLYYKSNRDNFHSLLSTEGIDAALDSVSAFIREICDPGLHSNWEEEAIRECRIPIVV